MPSNHLILCHPLLLLPSVFPSTRVFSNELAFCIRWLKYWNFSISPSNEYSGLISFMMDWLDLLAVQGTLESLFQHDISKASILWHSAFSQRRQWHSTPVLLPGKPHGRRSLVGYNPWGCGVGHGWATNTTCWVHTSELTHNNPIRCLLTSRSTYKQGNWDTKRFNKLPMDTKLATGSMENQSSEAPGPHLWGKKILPAIPALQGSSR